MGLLVEVYILVKEVISSGMYHNMCKMVTAKVLRVIYNETDEDLIQDGLREM